MLFSPWRRLLSDVTEHGQTKKERQNLALFFVWVVAYTLALHAVPEAFD